MTWTLNVGNQSSSRERASTSTTPRTSRNGSKSVKSGGRRLCAWMRRNASWTRLSRGDSCTLMTPHCEDRRDGEWRERAVVVDFVVGRVIGVMAEKEEGEGAVGGDRSGEEGRGGDVGEVVCNRLGLRVSPNQRRRPIQTESLRVLSRIQTMVRPKPYPPRHPLDSLRTSGLPRTRQSMVTLKSLRRQYLQSYIHHQQQPRFHDMKTPQSHLYANPPHLSPKNHHETHSGRTLPSSVT